MCCFSKIAIKKQNYSTLVYMAFLLPGIPYWEAAKAVVTAVAPGCDMYLAGPLQRGRGAARLVVVEIWRPHRPRRRVGQWVGVAARVGDTAGRYPWGRLRGITAPVLNKNNWLYYSTYSIVRINILAFFLSICFEALFYKTD